MLRLGRPVQWFFLAYLLVWTFGVGTSLTSACGVAAHALMPVFADPVQGKIAWGIVHSLAGLAIALLGTFRFCERLMGLLVAAMIVIVVVTGWMLRPDWSQLATGLLLPTVPDRPEAVQWTLAVMGGVGGTLTVLCYGYWIREENRTGAEDLRLCRVDLGISYAVMALFGVAMVIIATGLELSGAGATLVVDLADRLTVPLGSTSRTLFLLGAWAAVFSSLVGVWQAAPYLFADFWQLFRAHRSLDPDHFRPQIVNKKRPGLPLLPVRDRPGPAARIGVRLPTGPEAQFGLRRAGHAHGRGSAVVAQRPGGLGRPRVPQPAVHHNHLGRDPAVLRLGGRAEDRERLDGRVSGHRPLLVNSNCREGESENGGWLRHALVFPRVFGSPTVPVPIFRRPAYSLSCQGRWGLV